MLQIIILYIGNIFSAPDVVLLSHLLKNNTTVKVLKLGSQGIMNPGMRRKSKAPYGFGGNNERTQIGTEGAKAIGDLLRVNKTLEEFYLTCKTIMTNTEHNHC